MPARLSPSHHLRIGRSKAGLGLFARVAIKKEQFIVRYSGRKIATEVADQLDIRYLFEVNSRWTIDGGSRRNRARGLPTAFLPMRPRMLAGSESTPAVAV